MIQNLHPIEKQVIVLVEKVALFIQKQLGTINTTNIETKSLNSLVTYVDKNAEMQLVNGLQCIFPAATFLTEENTIEQKNGDWQWIIDPLDGTTNFIHQIPVFAISIALKYKNEIQLGVVYEINRKECFTAIKNNGAFLNNQKIMVSNTTTLADGLIATGFPYYDFEKVENYINVLRILMQKTRGVRRLGSAAMDLCYTACGKFDAFFEYSLAPWDVAAGALILEEAGGKVYDFSGNKNWLFGKEIIGVNANLSEEFLALIQNNFNIKTTS